MRDDHLDMSPSVSLGEWHAQDSDGRQRFFGRTGDHFTGRFETGAVTRTIPRRFRGIPPNKTAKVRTNRREPVDIPGSIAEGGNFLPTPTDNHSVARS